jgi:hypothetical protein
LRIVGGRQCLLLGGKLRRGLRAGHIRGERAQDFRADSGACRRVAIGLLREIDQVARIGDKIAELGGVAAP